MLAGVTQSEPDWDEDKKALTAGESMRRAYDATTRTWTHDAYKRKIKDAITTLTDELVVRLVSRGMVRDKKTWWSQRQQWMPSGSSSRTDLKKQLSNELGVKMQSFTKRMASEIDPTNPMDMMSKTLPTMKVRTSVKLEPGGRARVLTAADDFHSAISSFASAGIEAVMNIRGMALRQRPEDVDQWLRMADGWPEHVKLSYDFSAFDRQHNHSDLELLNISFAESFRKFANAHDDPSVMEDKAKACEWVAASIRNTVVKFPNEEFIATKSLMSGSRNTSRDNTILHEAYCMVVDSSLTEMLDQSYAAKARMCSGDDEVEVHKSWVTAVTKIYGMQYAGFDGSLAKQLIGERDDEFLKVRRWDGVITDAIAAPLIRLCAGQWETPITRDVIGTIESFGDTIKLNANRALSIGVATRLYNSVLDYKTRIPCDGSLMRTPWRMHATRPFNLRNAYSPLVSQTGQSLTKPDMSKLRLPKVLPSHMSQDMINDQWSNTLSKLTQQEVSSLKKSYTVGNYQPVLKPQIDDLLIEHSKTEWRKMSKSPKINLEGSWKAFKWDVMSWEVYQMVKAGLLRPPPVDPKQALSRAGLPITPSRSRLNELARINAFSVSPGSATDTVRRMLDGRPVEFDMPSTPLDYLIDTRVENLMTAIAQHLQRQWDVPPSQMTACMVKVKLAIAVSP